MRPLIITGEIARKAICRHVLQAPEGHVVTIKEQTRNLMQNALLWALLTDLSEQTDWHGIKLSPEEFKDLLSAGLVQSRVVPNLDGNGFVILGQRTSKMTKSQFAALIDLVYAFGIERGVVFGEHEAEIDR